MCVSGADKLEPIDKMERDSRNRRVAITGLGIVTAIGGSRAEFTENLFAGRCGIGPVSLFPTGGFPCRNAAQVEDRQVEAALSLISPRRARRVSRCDLLGLKAAHEAIEDAGLARRRFDRNAAGVVLGGGAGGMLSWERFRRKTLAGEAGARPSPLLAASPCTLTDLIAQQYGLGGERVTITTACSSSTTAIGYGADLVRSGLLDIVITGGAESLSELTFAGFNALRVMDPFHCRPFDRNRNGMSLGEGAAVLVLEAYDRAVEREATIYAEVLGYAVNADAFHMTSPDPVAEGMFRVMESALQNAGVVAGDVGYVNAHGTATPANDKLEVRAITRVFQRNRPAVSSTKSMVGHCLGAAGAIETAATALGLLHHMVPPTVHLEAPEPEWDLDFVPGRSMPRRMEIAMINNFAFGGNNTSLILRKGTST